MKPWQGLLNKSPRAKRERKNKKRGPKSGPEVQKPTQRQVEI
jgi:hypothetical protein